MNLQLSLKRKWFEMTKTVKPEDYREITPYWLGRLFTGFDQNDTPDILEEICHELINFNLTFKEIKDWAGIWPKAFEFNIMTLGYPKSTDTNRILKYKHAGIEIREGNPEWGAVPGKKYFVIKHGELIQPVPTYVKKCMYCGHELLSGETGDTCYECSKTFNEYSNLF